MSAFSKVEMSSFVEQQGGRDHGSYSDEPTGVDAAAGHSGPKFPAYRDVVNS
jgi:hypothetical protein